MLGTAERCSAELVKPKTCPQSTGEAHLAMFQDTITDNNSRYHTLTFILRTLR